MNIYDATEIAFKNGYEQGRKDTASEIFAEVDKIINDDRINRRLAERGLSVIRKIGEPNLEQQLAELKKKYMGGQNNQ